MKIGSFFALYILIFVGVYAHNECAPSPSPASAKKTVIQIILGSTRQERSSEKIAHALIQKAPEKAGVVYEIVDLRDYPLPFLNDSVAPASRKEITDPAVKKWSDKITQANAYIFIVPEYNGGYPGVLKNALDSLYKEWNNKPVGFVGYSGGPSGGTSAIAQLRTVTQALKMVPIACDLLIGSAWKALNTKGSFINKAVEQEFTSLVDHLITAVGQIK